MLKSSLWHVNKHVLLGIAGSIWLIAGLNVGRLGLLDYKKLPTISFYHIICSLIVFVLFGTMFYKMTQKHGKRIMLYEEIQRPIWNFFDTKSYIIMIAMMSGGISLRAFGLVSPEFVAVFYTGLGCALGLAGIVFWQLFFHHSPSKKSS
ncbi:MAG: hypothetical protein RR766_08280 [Longicatena sp.]